MISSARPQTPRVRSLRRTAAAGRKNCLSNQPADKRTWGAMIGPRHHRGKALRAERPTSPQLLYSKRTVAALEKLPATGQNSRRAAEIRGIILPQIFRLFSGPLSSRPFFVRSYTPQKKKCALPKKASQRRAPVGPTFFSPLGLSAPMTKKISIYPYFFFFFWGQLQTPWICFADIYTVPPFYILLKANKVFWGQPQTPWICFADNDRTQR